MQVRDVEASLQETLLTQFHDLVLARAAAAASNNTVTSQGAIAQLAPLLAALAVSGAAGAYRIKANGPICVCQCHIDQLIRVSQLRVTMT